MILFCLLPVGPDNLIQGNVGIAVPGFRIALARTAFPCRLEHQGFLRAVLDARQAVFALSGEFELAVGQGEIPVRTHIGAGHALYAAVFLQIHQPVGRHGKMLVLHPLEPLLIEKAHLSMLDVLSDNEEYEIIICKSLDPHIIEHLEASGYTIKYDLRQ